MEKRHPRPVTISPTGFTWQRMARAGAAVCLLFMLAGSAPLLLSWLRHTAWWRADDSYGVAPAAAQTVLNEVDEDNAKGYALARRDKISSHADCMRLDNSFIISGCQRYVTEQKHIPPLAPQTGYSSGKSTAACVAEVNAHWVPLIQDLRERGDDYAAETATRNELGPELQNCQNFDHVRIGKVIHEPMARLRDFMKKIEEGGKAAPEDIAVVRNDLPGVESFPANQYRTAYLKQARSFLDVAEGRAKPPARVRLRLSCNKLQEKIRFLLQSEEDMIERQAKLNRSNPAENQRWEGITKARINWLDDWKLYTDSAKASGCAYPDSL